MKREALARQWGWEAHSQGCAVEACRYLQYNLDKLERYGGLLLYAHTPLDNEVIEGWPISEPTAKKVADRTSVTPDGLIRVLRRVYQLPMVYLGDVPDVIPEDNQRDKDFEAVRAISHLVLPPAEFGLTIFGTQMRYGQLQRVYMNLWRDREKSWFNKVIEEILAELAPVSHDGMI